MATQVLIENVANILGNYYLEDTNATAEFFM